MKCRHCGSTREQTGNWHSGFRVQAQANLGFLAQEGFQKGFQVDFIGFRVYSSCLVDDF